MGQIDTNPAKQKRMADVPATQDGLHSEKPRHLGSPVEPVRVKLQDPIGYLADGLLASNVWTSEGITGTPRLFQRRGPPSASNNSSPTDSPGHSTSSGDGSHKSPDTQPCDNQIEHLSPLDESVDGATDPRTSWLAQAVPDKTENDQISENQQLESSSFSLDMAEEASGSRGPNTHGSEFDWKGPSEDFARSQLGDVNPDTLSPASSPGKSGSLSDSSYDTDSGFPRQSSIHSRSSSRGDLQESDSACLPPPPGLSLMDRIQEDFPRTPSPVFGSTFSSSAGMSATSRALQDRDNQVKSATRVLSQLRLGDFKEFTPQSSYAKYQVDDMVRQQHRCPLPEPGFASARSSHPFSPVAPVQPPFTSSLLASIQQSQSVSVSGYSQLGNPVPPPRWFPSEDRFATPSSPFLSAPTSLGGGTFGPPSGVNYRVNHGYVHESPFAIRPNDQMMKSHHLGAGFRDDPYDRVDLAYGRRPAYHRYKSPGGRRSDHEYFHPVAHSYSSNSLLEEFNSAPKSDRWELSTVKGHLLLFAKDQSGSRFIQQKLEKADERIKQEAFAEIYPNCLLLMTDVFGNYVIQKFLEYGTLHQQKLLVEKMTENMLSLALQVYGCRVIQRALEVTQVEEQLALIQQLHGHVMKCVVDQNGNHVLQKCVEAASWKRRMERGDLLSPLPAVQGSDIQFIIDSFVGHAASLSMHSYGCRVVQRVLEHCSPEQTRPILSEIIFKCRDLIKDQFGNYVVQHVVSHGDPEQRAVIKQTVFPEIARWSQHKYASNVVESCLEHASKAEISRLIDFILQCDETGSSCALLPMMKHMYGNYVVQKLMDRADECDRDRIVCIIRHNADYLKRFTFGKHVLGRLERAPSPPPAYY